jgi:hypothetical protein
VPWRHVGGVEVIAPHTSTGRVHAPAPMAVCGQTEILHYFTIVHPRYSTPAPAAKVSEATNVNMSNSAPCLAVVNERGSVGWDLYLARQHGSASAVSPKTSPHYRNHLFTVLTACRVLRVAVHSNNYWHHNTDFLSPHTAHFKLSVICCSDNCVGHLNNRAYSGNIMVHPLSEEHNLIVEIYLPWLYFTGEVGEKSSINCQRNEPDPCLQEPNAHSRRQPATLPYCGTNLASVNKQWWKWHLWRSGGSISSMCRAVRYKK